VAHGKVVLAVVGTALTLVGCYGSTEPATNVTATGATLNGKGTTNNGPAVSYFEYWPTENPSSKQITPDRSWPGGVSGPFSEPITGLTSGTAYSFRLCGHDAGGPTVCAQTRGIGDSVAGGLADSSGHALGVQARSGGSGENPNGTFGFVVSSIPRNYSVTCLAVTGKRAIVGGVRTPDDGWLLGFEDGSRTFGSQSTREAPNCAGTSFDSLPKTTATSGSVVVDDEP
jgi:hypothetical protein